MRITLSVSEGPNRGMAFTFDEHSTFVVGRSPEAHFVMPERDRYFSRIHFMVEVNPPLCRLVDMKSHNGTYLNGTRVQEADLKNGDRIQAGQTTLQVVLDSAAPATAASTLSLPGEGAGRTVTTPPLGVMESPLSAGVSSASTRDWTGAAPTLPQLTPAQEPRPDIPGYAIERELGRGGMGVVYLARCLADGTPVALKTILPAIPPTETVVARFFREANILKSLNHPRIVGFRDMGQAGKHLYFAMDYIESADADRLLKTSGPFGVARAVRLIGDLLEALAFAHGKGFVHRDVKPGNLLVASKGGQEHAYLADFGLARAYQASPLSGLTMTGRSGGTAAFMPPEQVLDFRSVKPAADQYAAAASLYRLLTDQHLYDGIRTSTDLMLKILQADPVSILARRPDLPPALAAIVDRALARKPEARFADVAAFRQALMPFAGA